MPPAIFVASSAGVVVGGAFRFTVPAAAKPGDMLLAIWACNDTAADVATPPAGWTKIANLFSGTTRVMVCKRTVLSTDPGVHILSTTVALTWAASCLLVYRGLSNDAALVGSAIAAIAATTNFACPSQTLVVYSDFYLGIVVVTSAAVAVTQPVGTSKRYDAVADLGGGRELEVFEFLQEAPGATGAKTATTAANQSGAAASLALPVAAMRGSKVIALDPSGAIGLPAEGI